MYDIGVFATDNNSDNQAASNPEKLFVKGENRVAQSGGAWNFSEIRSANYFINRVRPLLEAGELGAMKPTTNIIWVKPILPCILLCQQAGLTGRLPHYQDNHCRQL